MSSMRIDIDGHAPVRIDVDVFERYQTDYSFFSTAQLHGLVRELTGDPYFDVTGLTRTESLVIVAAARTEAAVLLA